MANIKKIQINDIEYDLKDASAVHISDIVQTTGDSETAVMSQAAVTDEFGDGYGKDTIYGYDITKNLDITNIDTSNPPNVNLDGAWDFQEAYMTYDGYAIYNATEISTRLLICKPNTTYRYFGMIIGTASICFYDIDKKFISGINASTIGKNTNFVIETPENCIYMKCTIHKDYIDDFKVLYEGKLKKNTTELSIENVNSERLLTFDKNVGDELYVHMKVEFPDDVHSVAETSNFFRIINKETNANLCAELNKALPTRNTTVYPLAPVPNYNAKVATYCNGVTSEECELNGDGWRRNFLIGEDTMSIRFKGDCTATENQDLMLQIDDNSLYIFHLTDWTYLINWALRDYPTMTDLYNALLTETQSGALTEFEVDFFNLDNYTPFDIIPCIVNLVAPYKREKEGDPVEYDAFPFYFTAKEKGKVYDVEISLKKNATTPSQIIIDGYGFKFGNPTEGELDEIFNNPCLLAFGDGGSGENGIEILSLEIRDKANFKYPNLRVYYAEQVKEGVPYNNNRYYLSERKLAEISTKMKQSNFGYIKMDNILDRMRGDSNGNSKNLYHFSHDDGVRTALHYKHLRATYLRKDIIPSFGMLMQSDITIDPEALAMVKPLRKIGYMFYPHTLYTDSPNSMTNLSFFSYNDLVNLVETTTNRFVELFEEYPIIWDFHEVGEGYNQVRFLMNKGFQLIFGATGNGLLSPINRYHCERIQFIDESNIDALVDPYLDNYIN